jgi:hypothetical protein
MRLLFQFDASASSYEIRGELAAVSSWSGVKKVELLEKVSGDAPRYCVEVEVADDQAQAVRDRARGIQGQNSGYVYNMKEISYRSA